MGHRRPVDRPFLAWLLGVTLPPPDPFLVPADVALWWTILLPARDPWRFVKPGDGPLVPQDHSIEVWTETELGALHAASRIARVRGDAALRRRCESAADWHVRHTQPDNATGHPWAIHVFVERATPDADLFAQTLLHNAMALQARPGRFAACILLDGAGALASPG